MDNKFTLVEKKSKKKKPYNSMVKDAGDVDYNISQFNKHMGWGDGKLNNTSWEAATPDGGSCVDSGAAVSSGSEGGGMGESLENKKLNEMMMDKYQHYLEATKRDFPELVKETQEKLDNSESKAEDYAILSVFYSKLMGEAFEKWDDATELFTDDEAMSPMPESVGKQFCNMLFNIKNLNILEDIGIWDGLQCAYEFWDYPSEENYKRFYNDCINYYNETFKDDESEQLEERLVKLTEDVASSMPVTPLPEQTIIDFAMSHLTTNPTNPKTFPLGYIKEFSNEIAAKFRGGRGSAGMPVIRIFKCTEYSALYTGIAWTKTDKTLAADSVLGASRHTGERTGFDYNNATAIANVIGSYQDGAKALQVYIDDSSVQKVRFYVSINNSDLALIDKKDLVPYLTPAAANKILAPAVIKAAGRDSAGDQVYDRIVNRLKLSNIYMIGNYGPKLM